MASLFGNIGKADFKALEELHLDEIHLADKALETLAAALNADRLPKLRWIYLNETEASEESLWVLVATNAR